MYKVVPCVINMVITYLIANSIFIIVFIDMIFNCLDSDMEKLSYLIS